MTGTTMAVQAAIPEGYQAFFRDLKERVRQAQLRAAMTINNELVLLYWKIGRDILRQQQKEGWGTKVINRLARDLQNAFPAMRGFSRRNRLFMRAMAVADGEEEIVKQLVSQIPWGHNIRILQKLKAFDDREWYIRKTIEQGWTRDVLVAQIDSGLRQRQGRAPRGTHECDQVDRARDRARKHRRGVSESRSCRDP